MSHPSNPNIFSGASDVLCSESPSSSPPQTTSKLLPSPVRSALRRISTGLKDGIAYRLTQVRVCFVYARLLIKPLFRKSYMSCGITMNRTRTDTLMWFDTCMREYFSYLTWHVAHSTNFECFWEIFCIHMCPIVLRMNNKKYWKRSIVIGDSPWTCFEKWTRTETENYKRKNSCENMWPYTLGVVIN